MQTFIDSLSTAIFGIAVVFLVLIGLIVLIKLMNIGVATAARRKKEPEIESVLAVEVTPAQPVAAVLAYQPQSLKLIDVDEPTAAIIMAIVCDEIGAPVNELYFKSIRLLNDQVPAKDEGV